MQRLTGDPPAVAPRPSIKHGRQQALSPNLHQEHPAHAAQQAGDIYILTITNMFSIVSDLFYMCIRKSYK